MISLGDSRRITYERSLEVLIVEPHVVCLKRVDIKLWARSISVTSLHIFNVHDTLTLEIAHAVVTELVWLVTGVSSGMEAPLVCLHDVKLRAELTTILRLLSSTVPVIFLPERAILELCRHQYLVQSSDTATRQIAEVDVVGDVTTQQVRLEVRVRIRLLAR